MYPHWQKIWRPPLTKSGKSTQIVNRIIELINCGDLVERDRLPPIYLLAKKLITTTETVYHAYLKLADSKLVEIKPGVGTFIAGYLPFAKEDHAQITLLKPWDFELNNGKPLKLKTPFISLGTVIPNLNQLASSKYLNLYSTTISILQKLPEQENPFKKEIKATFHNVLKNRGIIVKDNEFKIITQGAALRCAIKVLLKPDDIAVMDAAEDLYVYNIFQDYKVKVLFAGSSEQGFNLQKLERLCKVKKISLVFIRPSASSPGLNFMNDKSRDEMVALSLKYKFIIISLDDNYGWWHKQPIAPLFLRKHTGNIIYIGPISNVLDVTNDINLVVGQAEIVEAIELQASKNEVYHDILVELTISRLIQKEWLTRDSARLLRLYHHRQDKIGKLFNQYLSEYAHLKIPISGLGLYISFKTPICIAPIIDKLIQLSVFDEYKNMQVDINKPIKGISIGYALFAPSHWETVFQIIAEHLITLVKP